MISKYKFSPDLLLSHLALPNPRDVHPSVRTPSILPGFVQLTPAVLGEIMGTEMRHIAPEVSKAWTELATPDARSVLHKTASDRIMAKTFGPITLCSTCNVAAVT